MFYEKEKPIPPEDYVRVDHLSLKSYVSEIFVKLGTRRDYADIVADVLVKADLMGISSHGVQRIKRYIGGILNGNIEPNNEPEIDADVGATLLLDGRKGFGQIVGVKAMELAIEKTKYYGLSLVLVHNSNHFGIAGYYSLIPVNRGYIGVTATNSRPLVAYTHTVEQNIGTNPLAIGIPRKNPPPILFDAATSVIPVGKIELYSRVGKEIPYGWVIDRGGRILTGEPARIMDSIKKGEAALLPLGGVGEEYGGHKGSSLSFLIDVFTGVLSGAAWGKHVRHTIDDKPSNVGHLFMVIDIDCFMDREIFFERLEKYIEEIKSSKKHPEADNIWIPGEKAWLTMKTREKIGIPLHKSIYEELIRTGEEYGVKTKLLIKESK